MMGQILIDKKPVAGVVDIRMNTQFKVIEPKVIPIDFKQEYSICGKCRVPFKFFKELLGEKKYKYLKRVKNRQKLYQKRLRRGIA